MPKKSTSGGIHVDGDVSGVIVYGDDNTVTTHQKEAPTPAENRPHQENRAEDSGTVYAVTHGTMNITVKHEHDDEESG
jgi:hypothetical protein